MDFSLLPEVVWVSIMRYLPFHDRNNISQTCRQLHDIFHHPSLWNKVEIILSSRSEDKQPPDVTFISTERILKLIENFGNYIKKLTLVYISYDKAIPESCKSVLEALQTCHFEEMVIDFETVLMVGKQQEVEPVLRLVSNAKRLQSLSLRSWPAYDDCDCDRIMNTLVENTHMRHIEKLALFWEKASDATWVSLNKTLPNPEQVLSLVQNFSNLRYLSLRSTMLSEEIIKTLSRSSRAPLSHLGLLVTYVRWKPDAHLPDISSKTWAALRNSSEELRVDLTFVTRMSSIARNHFMKPEIPVGCVSFMKYASLSPYDVQSLIHKYSSTLNKFVSYADCDIMDQDLYGLVSMCPNINSFIYHGSISSQTVRDIVSLRNKWYQFEILQDKVITQDLPQDIDDDTVVARSDSGEVYIVRRLPEEQDEDVRQGILRDLERDVSVCLGYTWHLRDGHSLQRKVYGGRSNTLVDVIPTRYLIAKGWPWIES